MLNYSYANPSIRLRGIRSNRGPTRDELPSHYSTSLTTEIPKGVLHPIG